MQKAKRIVSQFIGTEGLEIIFDDHQLPTEKC